MAVSGLPTREFLLEVARQLSGAEIIDFKTRYNGEVASQWVKADVGMDFKKIAKLQKMENVPRETFITKVIEVRCLNPWMIGIRQCRSKTVPSPR